MPQPQTEWTLEMVHALPDDGNRYELLDGELLVSPTPSLLHQRVLLELYDRVRRYVLTLGGYETLLAPVAVQFSSRRELQPDLLVMPLKEGRKVARFTDIGRLLLAVEVLSPSTLRNDCYKKRAVYQQEGVPEYWVLDPASRLVERWLPQDAAPEVLLDVVEWRPDASRDPLAIDLRELFRDAIGE